MDMAPAHTEIQKVETGSGQDVEDADADLEAAWAALEPDSVEVYTGEVYVTARDIMEKYDECETTARNRAAKAVKEETMVQVDIPNPNRHKGGHRYVQAWVPTQIYKEWKQNNDADNAEQSEGD
jgi:hypothetical protein